MLCARKKEKSKVNSKNNKSALKKNETKKKKGETDNIRLEKLGSIFVEKLLQYKIE